VEGREKNKQKEKLFFLRTKSITFFKFIKNEKRETKNGKMCKWERVHVGGRRKVGKKVNPVIFNVYTLKMLNFLN
jgi:hypothetical protein